MLSNKYLLISAVFAVLIFSGQICSPLDSSSKPGPTNPTRRVPPAVSLPVHPGKVAGDNTVPIYHNLAWEIETALVDESFIPGGGTTPFYGDRACPIAGKKLYRGSSKGFRNLAHVVQMFIGNELAEYPSWRFAKFVRENFSGSPGLEEWRNLKEQGSIELAIDFNTQTAKPKCQEFAYASERDTWEGVAIATKEKSWGIASIANYDTARGYGTDIILEILENHPRAALVTKGSQSAMGSWPGQEFYFPIVIPAADVTAAWSATHSVKKIEKTDRFQEVQIYKEIGFPNKPKHSTTLIGRIVACKDPANCVSDPIPGGDVELQQMVDMIPKEGVLNPSKDGKSYDAYYFRFVKP